MFPQFVSTAVTFSRATALLTRVGTDAQFYDDPETDNFAVLLDSKYEAEKTEGMKRLIALMSQGRDVSNFFPQVVKNVVTQSLELKKLVYIYLVHCAEKRPDEALLAINTFQKDLSDLNPLVRAWALRAMSGIQVRVVLPLVVMAVNKCVRDPSPYVRRCAAHAVSKIYFLDREQHVDALEELICLLMNDSSPGVIGAVTAAFTVVCPEKLFLWGARYDKFCEFLPDIDEWGQVVLIDILLRFAVGRYGYPEGSMGMLSVEDKGLVKGGSHQDKPKGKMQDQMSPEESDAKLHINGGHKETAGNDGERSPSALNRYSKGPEFWLSDTINENPNETPEEIRLLLRSTLPLLCSHNSAVVMAAAGVHWLLAVRDNLHKIVGPVLFLLRSSFDSQYVVLANIVTFVKKVPSLFEMYYEDFFISSLDTEPIRVLKLDILCLLATENSIQHILEEFQAYVRDPDRQFASNTVRAIGQCALRLPTVAKACTEALLLLARSGSSPSNNDVNDGREGDQEVPRKERLSRGSVSKSRHKVAEGEKRSREALVVTEAVSALRIIVHENPVENEEILARLFRGLDQLKVPAARAILISMVGEFTMAGTHLPQMVPVILQYLGGTFKVEANETKLQILNCAAKAVLRSSTISKSSPSRTPLLLLDYLLRLAAQDLSYDIRDLARLYQQLLGHQLQNVDEYRKSGNGGGIADRLLDLSLEECKTVEVNGVERNDEIDSQKASYLTSGRTNDVNIVAQDQQAVLLKLVERILLITKPVPNLPSLASDRSAFAIGTMSHIVVHRAPNYFPIPIPHSFELGTTSSLVGNQQSTKAVADLGSSSNEECSGTVSEEGKSYRSGSLRSTGSGSFHEEDGAVHLNNFAASSSEDEHLQSSGRKTGRSEVRPSLSQDHRRRSMKGKRASNELGLLINLSGSEAEAHAGRRQFAEFGLLSAAELDDWLGSAEPHKEDMVSSSSTLSGYATISIGKLEGKPRVHSLLDFTNGGGLNVKYSFERLAPKSTDNLLSIKLYFENRSMETLSGIVVTDAELGGNYDENREAGDAISQGPVSKQEISELQSGGKGEGNLSVPFQSQLKPIRLSVLCSGQSYFVKIIPEIGALIRPIHLHPDAFSSAESKITGMYEALRRCTLIIPAISEGSSPQDDQILLVARIIAQKVLSHAHVSLVSTRIPIVDLVLGEQSIKSGGLQGLFLQFSGETLARSVLCLIVVTVLTDAVIGKDGALLEVLVKINCEDTVFGLSLLQELSKAFNSFD